MLAPNRSRVLFTLGGPGSGKGTQCKLLAQHLHMLHLSAGELLRRELTINSEHSQTISSCISTGRIVPAEITISLLQQEMTRLRDLGQIFVIDGFPRNKDNFDKWFLLMKETEVLAALHFLCPDEILRARLMRRNEGRSDDTPERIEQRIVTYHQETAVALAQFQTLHKSVLVVNADGSVDTVAARVKEVVQSFLAMSR